MFLNFMDVAGIEPAASSLRTKHSADELHAHKFELEKDFIKLKKKYGSYGIRTHDPLVTLSDSLRASPRYLNVQVLYQAELRTLKDKTLKRLFKNLMEMYLK